MIDESTESDNPSVTQDSSSLTAEITGLDRRRVSKLTGIGLDTERPMERIGELFDQRDELFAHISAHLEMFSKEKPGQFPSAIQEAVAEFRNFFVGYINYFFALAFDETVTIEGRSRESILAEALNNARQLWGQLSRAINQRFNPVYTDKLQTADSMAQEMLRRVGILISGTPIIYFDKSFQISRHPFQTNPLIGISLDSYEQTGKASFAHELGHHVFWNNGEMNEHFARLESIRLAIAGIVFQESLPAVDLSNPGATHKVVSARFEKYEIWSSWIEEVFADLFGTLILGPRFVKGLQDIILREWVKDTPEMVVHDGEHPMPALRPYIASETMKIVATRVDAPFRTELEDLIARLERRWEQQVWGAALIQDDLMRKGESGTPIQFGDFRRGSLVTLAELRSQVSSMVKMILEEVKLVVKERDTKQSIRLIDAIQFWGRDKTDAEEADIKQLTDELNRDRAVTHQNRAKAGTNVPEGRDKALEGDDELFQRFHAFVVERRTNTEKSEVAPRAEWLDVIEFNLSLEQGDKPHTDEKSDHGHPKKHLHNGNLIVWT